MSIRANVIFFQDGPELLKRCLTSIRPHVDSILAIDGAFANFEHEKPFSTDGCLEVAKELADEVIEVTEPWCNEIAKRNAYLTLTDPKDYYFLIDADEYVTEPLPKLTEDFYGCHILNPSDPTLNSFTYYCRLFRHQEGLRYKRKHSWLYLKGRLMSIESHNSQLIKLDYTIWHTPELRGQTRLDEDWNYTIKEEEPDHPDELPIECKLDMQINKWAAKPPPPISKPIKVKCVIQYSGFDYDNTCLFLKPGQEVMISKRKWNDL
jgi:hypothetical protein